VNAQLSVKPCLARPLLFDALAAVPSAMALRPYQQRAIDAVAALRSPGQRVLCVAPTGAGKTVIAAQMILDELARGGRVLFLAHRIELIAQTYGKVLAMGLPEAWVGVLMANGVITHPVTGLRTHCGRPLAKVQVASIDTIRSRRPPPGITLVIIDECHRALSKSYRSITAAYPEAFHVGFTATPYRGDGRGLGDLYRELVVVTTPAQLMADGYLAEPRVFTHRVKADLSQVSTVAGDYDQEQLAAAVDKANLVGNIVEHWLSHLAGVRTVAFAASVAHSRHIVANFVSRGVPAEHLDGETPPHERAAILARVDRGETLVVSNCAVLCEGWDQPSVKGCILARPTKSEGRYIQEAGRVLRVWNGVTPIILDHAGSVRLFGMPQEQDASQYSLEGKKKREKQNVSGKDCIQCFGWIPAASRVCPFCGVPQVAPDEGHEPKEITEADGQLVQVRIGDIRKASDLVRDLRRDIQHAAEECDHRNGFEPGTTNGRLKRKFRKGRAEMDRAELEAVRAFLSSKPFDPPPMVFTAPRVAAGGASW